MFPLFISRYIKRRRWRSQRLEIRRADRRNETRTRLSFDFIRFTFQARKVKSRRLRGIFCLLLSKSHWPLIAGERPPPLWCSTRRRTWLARTSGKCSPRMGLARPLPALGSLSSINRMCPTSRSRRTAPCTRPRVSIARLGRITASP